MFIKTEEVIEPQRKRVAVKTEDCHAFQRLKHDSPAVLRDQSDYIKRICKQVKPLNPPKPDSQEPSQIQRKITESKQIAEFFYILNQTNWCKFDDKFYLISRRWFERWKQYVNYDYVVKSLVEEGLRESDLSYNKMLSNNTLPSDIQN